MLFAFELVEVTDDDSGGNSHKSDDAAIYGGIVGGIVGAALISGGISFFLVVISFGQLVTLFIRMIGVYYLYTKKAAAAAARTSFLAPAPGKDVVNPINVGIPSHNI
jgi:hypothetical protein